MPNKDNNIIKYNQGKKSIKVTICCLCRFRMFTRKNEYVSK